ncbi:cyclin domain-containing protein [Cyclospora cayetanensis]|uniref:Cyclin domain-containing protein n=1 Tax=Cyclospora cayetanensis TaxID=88456 RepID=A0A1D3CYY3_9EIME|nr:cyclin domain-containing protein [Cyclospora cayetanensis]
MTTYGGMQVPIQSSTSADIQGFMPSRALQSHGKANMGVSSCSYSTRTTCSRHHTLSTESQSSFNECVDIGGASERETAATTAAATPPLTLNSIPNLGHTHARNRHSKFHWEAKKWFQGPSVTRFSRESGFSFRVSPSSTGSLTARPCRHSPPSWVTKEEQDELPEFILLRHTELSFVCVGSLVSLLETCCTISHFGGNDRLQQLHDLTASPFHCSSRPHIGLKDYLVKRIFRHGNQCINDAVVALTLLTRFLCVQNTLLASALPGSQTPYHQQQNHHDEHSTKSQDAERSCKILHSKLDARTAAPVTRVCLAVTAAQIGFVEFNYLTAHRLLLTSALLAKKCHGDEHTSIRQWAQAEFPLRNWWRQRQRSYKFLAGLRVCGRGSESVGDMLLRRVQVTLDEFFATALGISFGDSRLLGKQGQLLPPRGNSATTALFVQHHSMMLLRHAHAHSGRPKGVPRVVNIKQLVNEPNAVEKARQQQRTEDLACCMCPSCGILQCEQNMTGGQALPFGLPGLSDYDRLRTMPHEMLDQASFGFLPLPCSMPVGEVQPHIQRPKNHINPVDSRGSAWHTSAVESTASVVPRRAS